jgi:prepilin-type N-terminal cleavage/methylation domain-containing protein
MKSGYETSNFLRVLALNKKSSGGFTLIEVMIAITVFATFMASFMLVSGSNVSDSMTMRRELILQKLCSLKMNSLQNNPPELSENLTLKPEVGNFDEDGFPDYEWSVEYKKMVIPDLAKIQGETGEDTDKAAGDNAIKTKIFDMIKKNTEELLWQVKVSVNEKNQKFTYSLSSFIRNEKGKVKIELQ